MSAFAVAIGGKADMRFCNAHVGFWPKADIEGEGPNHIYTNMTKVEELRFNLLAGKAFCVSGHLDELPVD